MTVEQKTKLYDKALEKAKSWYVDAQIDFKKSLETLFPELKESEDERIRKLLIRLFRSNTNEKFDDVSTQDIIAWLEKQSEQKPFDYENTNIQQKDFASKQEPKFHVGDTMRTLQEANDGYTNGMPVVVSIDNEYYHCTNELIAIKDQDNYEFPPINVKQKHNDKPKFKVGDWITSLVLGTARIIGVNDSNKYQLEYTDGKQVFSDIDYVNYEYDKWAIQDAKDGDMLVDVYGNIGIYKSHDAFDWISYCDYNRAFRHFEVEHESDKTFPAAKEQRDTLMKAMVDAGYTFDFEKKELNEIGQKPTEWSKEDEYMVERLLGWLNTLVNYIHSDAKVSLDLRIDRMQQVNQLKIWLKSIQQRIGG